MDDILVGKLADLDEDALIGIRDSSSAQAGYLGRFQADREAAAMAAVCGLVAVAAESALLRRQTGVTL